VFRAFVVESWGAIAAEIEVRSTQTNEVARCAALVLALGLVPQPVALIEVGASAGLCLLPDRYRYVFGDTTLGDTVLGHGDAGLRIDVELGRPAPIPNRLADISWRRGIDLNPLDVTEPSDVAWLQACIWPEHQRRRRRLDTAVAIAAENPPRIVRGDLLDSIGSVLDEAPDDATKVVVHSAVLSYVGSAQRRDFAELLAARDDVTWFSNEAPGVIGTVRSPDESPRSPDAFLLAQDGVTPLASTDPHGSWIDWLAPD